MSLVRLGARLADMAGKLPAMLALAIAALAMLLRLRTAARNDGRAALRQEQQERIHDLERKMRTVRHALSAGDDDALDDRLRPPGRRRT